MASLDPFNQVLGKRKAKHLLRRATFNYTIEKINAFALMNIDQAMAELCVKSAVAVPEPINPRGVDSDDVNWLSSTELPKIFNSQSARRAYITAWWWYNAYNQTSLEHKLTFFLHTSFTVSKDGGTSYSTYFYDHLKLLQHYSFGNIKALASKITLDNAMLYYLDNKDNNANNPNENYAREFLELFTILKGSQKGLGDYTNYKEEDVQTAARVFSGFKNQSDRSIIDPDTNLPMGYGNVGKHDSTDKTFSSAFGNHTITGKDTEAGMLEEHSDFVNMVFAQDATALSYVKKLYRYFVKSEWSSEVDTKVLIPLAQELKTNGYELLPIVKKLLSSNHFFDADDTVSTDNIIGAIVKNPLQLVTEICSAFNYKVANPKDALEQEEFYHFFFRNFIHNSCLQVTNLNLFAPDTVAGYAASYQGPDFDRHWFTSTAIIGRYKMIQSLLVGKDLIAGWGKLKYTLDTVAFVDAKISNPYDADVIITEISELLYPEAIDASRHAYFLTVFLDVFDKVYWTGAWGDFKDKADDTSARIRLDELITAMVNAPEFQLM